MSSLKLTLALEGTIGKFPICPLELIFELTGQTAASGPKEVTVPANTAPGSLSVNIEPMTTQNLLFICPDKDGAGVQYQLNGDGIDRSIPAGSFAIHPGGPVLTALDFGNSDLTKAASVTVLQLGLL